MLRIVSIVSIASIALGFLVGGADLNRKPAEQAAAAGRCPLIYAPVVCDHGKTYPNLCVANQHHAKNCVPTGL